MTTGEITNLRAHITLFVRGAGGQGNIEFTVDTGFTGAITLPPAACAALQLPLLRKLPRVPWQTVRKYLWKSIFLP